MISNYLSVSSNNLDFFYLVYVIPIKINLMYRAKRKAAKLNYSIEEDNESDSESKQAKKKGKKN
jgi:hypothetical protein